jgi:hypothetical protein
MMRSILTFYLLLITAAVNAQSMEKTIMASAGNHLINSENSISFTIGEPLIGMVHNDASINQGFWAGSLVVELITEVKDLNGIKVFPNPMVDELNIFTDSNKLYGITLFGVDGKRALKQKVDTSLLEYKINLSYLSKGVYVLRLFIEGSQEEKLFKIIKQ